MERTSIINDIVSKFSKKNGVQTVALVGIGGSGKTTVARQYARISDASIIWEINTETRDSIITSFQELAYAICQSTEEQQEINQIQQLQDIDAREQRVFLFLNNKIKNYPNWLIIYDQVNNFQDIVKYLPHDETIWENGKIIITTNNTNITHSSYIPNENIIYIPELNDEEKLQLFTNIISKNDNTSEQFNTDYISCLKHIPPFPLDVSIAAHYIKETHIPCEQYLQYNANSHNANSQENFLSAQKTILKDVGGYVKTRYDIVTTSIKHIMEISKDFEDLLFFISVLDCQNIPKNLLGTYKDNVTVDSFLHELKKFSLTTQNIINSTNSFSIHPCTQSIVLTYFLQSAKAVRTPPQLQNIVASLKNYMANEIGNYDLTTIQLLIPHVEVLLNHSNLFSESDKASLSNKLGVCYFYMAKYARAQTLLEETLAIYSKHYGEYHINTAKVLARLGAVHRNIVDYKKAQELFEKAIIIYEKNYKEDSVDIAWISIYLGSVYRNVGEYDKSIKLLKRGFEIYKKHYGIKDVRTIRASAYLANIYKDMGNYAEAEKLLNAALKSYIEHYGKEHTKTAWTSVRLANVYRNMGDYDKAIELLNAAIKVYKLYNTESCVENAWILGHLGATYSASGNAIKAQKLLIKSLELYNEHLQSDNIAIGWIKYHLGNTYRTLKDYEKSQQLLEESLNIHIQYYGSDSIETARIFNSLGETLIIEGDTIQAKKYIEIALKIFTIKKHPDQHKTSKLLNSLQ